MPGELDTAEVAARLAEGPIEPIGRIVDSSNRAVLVRVGTGDAELFGIHKPQRFEQPLWDYPSGSLAARERAAYLISELGHFELVPPTVLHRGPWGWGSTQLWLGDPQRPGDHDLVVDVVAPDQVREDWLVVLEGETDGGRPVVVAHSGAADVRAAAVLDAVLNNSDRKGGHLLRVDGRLWGVDHGVSLGVEPKLRTVLWGWAGEPLTASDLGRLEQLAAALRTNPDHELHSLLTGAEMAAIAQRTDDLLTERLHPQPKPGWPVIPWPAL